MPKVRAVDEQRREKWLALAGTDTLPVLSRMPCEDVVNGSTHRYYELDFRRLTEDQYLAFARKAAQKNALPFAYVYMTMHRDGMRLDAEGLEVVEE